jgi:hypothetical protein
MECNTEAKQYAIEQKTSTDGNFHRKQRRRKGRLQIKIGRQFNILCLCISNDVEQRIDTSNSLHINAEQGKSTIQRSKDKSASKIHKSTRNKSIQATSKHDRRTQHVKNSSTK